MNKSNNAVTMANRLIDAGATIPETAEPTNLLRQFIESEHDSGLIIRALLNAGANLDIKGSANFLGRQEDILLLAIKAGCAENVKALLQYAQENNLCLPKGEAIIAALDKLSHSEYTEKEKEIVVTLLDAGAPVNHQDDMGRTPLYLAASHGDADIAKVLLKKGAKADILVTDTVLVGRTAIDVAIKKDHHKVVSLLQDA